MRHSSACITTPPGPGALSRCTRERGGAGRIFKGTQRQSGCQTVDAERRWTRRPAPRQGADGDPLAIGTGGWKSATFERFKMFDEGKKERERKRGLGLPPNVKHAAKDVM